MKWNEITGSCKSKVFSLSALCSALCSRDVRLPSSSSFLRADIFVPGSRGQKITNFPIVSDKSGDLCAVAIEQDVKKRGFLSDCSRSIFNKSRVFLPRLNHEAKKGVSFLSPKKQNQRRRCRFLSRARFSFFIFFVDAGFFVARRATKLASGEEKRPLFPFRWIFDDGMRLRYAILEDFLYPMRIT